MSYGYIIPKDAAHADELIAKRREGIEWEKRTLKYADGRAFGQSQRRIEEDEREIEFWQRWKSQHA
jgi:hypothetical protein